VAVAVAVGLGLGVTFGLAVGVAVGVTVGVTVGVGLKKAEWRLDFFFMEMSLFHSVKTILRSLLNSIIAHGFGDETLWRCGL
jgi:hypothetical protein